MSLGLPVDPDDVVSAALATEGVVRLDGGLHGEVATYLPGRRVPGVRVRQRAVEVHVVVDASRDVQQTAAQVRAAVLALAPDLPIDVVVADLLLPEELAAEAAHGAGVAPPGAS